MILTVPIFPLPDTVFFPNTMLPLHVFEPRYKKMVGRVLETDQLMGVVQLRPGWHDDYFGTPPVYKMLGVGKVIDVERWPDGRFDLVLSGMYRTHVIEELESQDEYRIAKVEVVADMVPAEKEAEVQDVHEILLRIFDKLSDALPEGLTILPGGNAHNLAPGKLVDVMASLLVDDAYERQSLLAEPDVSRRQQLLRVQIRNMFNPLPMDEE